MTFQSIKKERKDITPTQETIDQPDQSHEQPSVENNDLRDEINSKFAQLGIKTNKDASEWLKQNAPNIDPKTATEAEMVGLIELLNMNIDLELAKQATQSNDDDLLE